MMKAVSRALIALAFTGGAVAGGDPVPAEAEAVSRTSDDQGRLICRNEKMIGSNRTTRVCRTREELDAGREDAQRAFRSRAGTPRGRD